MTEQREEPGTVEVEDRCCSDAGYPACSHECHGSIALTIHAAREAQHAEEMREAQERVAELERAMRDWMEHNGCSASPVSCDEIHRQRFALALAPAAPAPQGEPCAECGGRGKIRKDVRDDEWIETPCPRGCPVPKESSNG